MSGAEQLAQVLSGCFDTDLSTWKDRMIAAAAPDVLFPEDAVALAAGAAEQAEANRRPGTKTITLDVDYLIELAQHGTGQAAADARRALMEIARQADRGFNDDETTDAS